MSKYQDDMETEHDDMIDYICDFLFIIAFNVPVLLTIVLVYLTLIILWLCGVLK
jgi:hypothetical protein